MVAKLQFAIDINTPEEALALVKKVSPSIDIIEAGTPFIKRFGLGILNQIRQVAPDKKIVADMKAMDAGAFEAMLAFEAGADIMTVLGCADDDTIRGALAEANKRNRAIAVDLIAIPDKVQRAKELAAMGVQYIGVHTGLDAQAKGATPLADLKQIREAVDTPIMVAGGIKASTIKEIAALGPAIIIAGGSIYGAADPTAAAAELRQALGQ